MSTPRSEPFDNHINWFSWAWTRTPNCPAPDDLSLSPRIPEHDPPLLSPPRSCVNRHSRRPNWFTHAELVRLERVPFRKNHRVLIEVVVTGALSPQPRLEQLECTFIRRTQCQKAFRIHLVTNEGDPNAVCHQGYTTIDKDGIVNAPWFAPGVIRVMRWSASVSNTRASAHAATQD